LNNENYVSTWYILLLPIIGFLIQALFGKRVVDALGPARGKKIMGALAVIPIALAFVIGVAITMALGELESFNRDITLTLFDWIDVGGLRIPMELKVDPLSMTMVLIITGIGALIHLYATGYMSEERDYTRFFTYLNLFVAAMLILVLGGNLALMFIGWEGVGLCSYLLIGFWYKDVSNAKAANKAFIVNRIGDWGLTLGMFLLVIVLVSAAGNVSPDHRYLSYDVILNYSAQALKGQPALATAIALLFFVGACGKSAQFPLYLWLPDAMAGPTPVSALIHAATMVTAGVFMLNRLHILFELSPIASAIVAAIGAFTALFAALVAFGQTDIKKVLAYSTVSQLGFMFIACGAGAYWVGMFHVTTHAFFKALLFLGSGAVIHAMAHNQDMRNYGKLAKYLPITCWTMFVGYLAIAGVPFLSGFYSKEGILGAALAGDHAVWDGVRFGYYAGWVGLFVAALTAMYMTRMTWLTFFGSQERWRLIPANAHAHDVHHEDGHHVSAQPALAHETGEHEHGGTEFTTEDPERSIAEHAHAGHHDHGPDTHRFFLTDEQAHAAEHAEHDGHHHELDENHKPHEVPISMWFPLVVLALLSAGGGWYLASEERLMKWLYPANLPVLGEVSIHPHHGVESNLLWLSIGAASLGIIAGLIVYRRGLPQREGWDETKWNPFRIWARDQFGYDRAMVSASVDGGREVGELMWKGADATLIDGAVNGAAKTAGGMAWLLRWIQTGYVRMYALVMLLGTVGILGWLMYALWLRGNH
jgi:NADH-quinone oxidoreductase subunit L